MRAFAITAWILALAAMSGKSAAAPAPVVQQRAVDMVSLAGGERLFGMFIGPPRGGELQMLVDRAWLRKHAPNVYRKATAGEAERRKQALDQLRDRLAAWRERRTEPRLLTSFLDRSLDEAKAKLAALDQKAPREPSQLLLISVPLVQVRRQYEQPPETRRVLGLVWEQRLAGAEDLPKAALVEQLKAQKIDPDEAQPDLSERIDVLPLDDRQWAAKMALAEYAILGQPHFQGSGGLLVRDDNGQARPALGDLIAGLAKSQLEDALGDLLGPAGGGAKQNQSDKLQQAIDKATRTCDDEGATGARITQLDQDLARRQVTVSDRFLAKMPDGSWQAVWQFASTIDASQPRANEEQALAQDPEVAEALKTVKNLGLDIDPELLRTAMRSGVATQAALQAVDRAFADYLLANTRRLDGPPLNVPDATPRKAER